jgi:hypothetical protein
MDRSDDFVAAVFEAITGATPITEHQRVAESVRTDEQEADRQLPEGVRPTAGARTFGDAVEL